MAKYRVVKGPVMGGDRRWVQTGGLIELGERGAKTLTDQGIVEPLSVAPAPAPSPSPVASPVKAKADEKGH